MPERRIGPSPLSGIAPADCAACPHRALLSAGHCVPGDICLIANSGRQIDRFLRRNPQFAEANLADGFWERRAIAARHAPLEALRQRPRDEDEVVRRVVASRLPVDELDDYLHDSDREVRMTVANRLAPQRLNALIGDADYLVRLQVAKRLPHGQLPRMAQDEDREVRKEVARRLPPFALGLMAQDEDAEVRRIVAERMLPDDAEIDTEELLEELAIALRKLLLLFAQWQAKKINAFELNDHIHQYHQHAAQAIAKIYTGPDDVFSQRVQ